MTTTQPRLERISLEQLTTGANVRIELRLNDELVKSIKANGIIQPIVVYPDPDVTGLYRILAGHRRAAAAAKAGLTEVDVIVRDIPDDTGRVVDQLVENVHRDALTMAEQAGAYRQLSMDFGLPAIQIAKRTATKLDRVGDAIKAAGSTAASAVLEHAPWIGFDVLAKIAEFDGDTTAVKKLTEIASTRPEQLEHHLHEIREASRIRAEKKALRARLDELGVPIGKGDDYGYPQPPFVSLERLVHPDTPELDLPTTVGEADEVPDVPGIAALVFRGWDAGTYRGLVRWVVDSNAEHGLVDKWKARNGALDDDASANAADREAEEEALVRRAAERAEYEARALAARTVRRAWLTEQLTKPTLPDGAETYIAVKLIDGLTLTTEGEDLWDGELLALTFLGKEIPNEADPDAADEPDFDPTPRKEVLYKIAELDRRPMHAIVALVLADIETRLERGVRRGDRDVIQYFETLEIWGYGLSDHERAVITPLAEADDAA